MNSSENMAYRALRERILVGNLNPGERVSDFALSSVLGVSRTPVREAIRRLQAEGLVETAPTGGACVRLLSLRELAELVELREALEVFAVRQAVPRLTAADVAALREHCAVMHACAAEARARGGTGIHDPIGSRPTEADVEFHMIFMRRAGNRRLIRLLGDWYLLLQATLRHYRRLAPNGPNLVQVLSWIWRDHQRIYRAAARGDATAAARGMATHIRLYPRRLIPEYAHWADGDKTAATTNASLAERWLLADDTDAELTVLMPK